MSTITTSNELDKRKSSSLNSMESSKVASETKYYSLSSSSSSTNKVAPNHHHHPYDRNSNKFNKNGNHKQQRRKSNYGGGKAKQSGKEANTSKPSNQPHNHHHNHHQSASAPLAPPIYPCRVIFIRNVPFDSSEKDIHDLFETFGEIKGMFSLISKRGMVFITYYDLRAAVKAKEAMDEFKLNDRKLDVHYSLPRDQNFTEESCDKTKNQGTIFMTIKHVSSPIKREDLIKVFGPFGDIKDIRNFRDTMNQRFVEYYDSRDCVKAFEALNGCMINGGVAELKLSYDLSLKQRLEIAEYSEETKAGGKYHIATLRKKGIPVEPKATEVSSSAVLKGPLTIATKTPSKIDSDDEEELLSQAYDPYKDRESPTPEAVLKDGIIFFPNNDNALSFLIPKKPSPSSSFGKEDAVNHDESDIGESISLKRDFNSFFLQTLQ